MASLPRVETQYYDVENFRVKAQPAGPASASTHKFYKDFMDTIYLPQTNSNAGSLKITLIKSQNHCPGWCQYDMRADFRRKL